jgi:hypothetical protein
MTLPEAMHFDLSLSGQHSWTMRRRPVVALVWAVDDEQAADAVEYLRSGLWPSRYLYEIAEVQEVLRGVPCPLRRDDSAVLEYELRDGWMWVLVAPGLGSKAVVPCC